MGPFSAKPPEGTGFPGGAGERCLPLPLLLQNRAEAETGLQQAAKMNLMSGGKEEAGAWLPGRRQHLACMSDCHKAGIEHYFSTTPEGKVEGAVCRGERMVKAL